MNDELRFNAAIRRLSNKKGPQTAGTVGSHEAKPAKNEALSPKRTTSWRDWLDLQLDNRWLTDGGELTSDWTVSA